MLDICQKLNIAEPQYFSTQNAKNSNFWSTRAEFLAKTSPAVFGKDLGHVKHVHGKKNALEQCAKLVYQRLLEYEQQQNNGRLTY
jgi:hypothetical protein